jgi:tRNA(Arg) A34 adenosine deaminase TadA
MERWILRAFKLAQHSPHPNHQMAAIVVKGGSVLSKAYNLERWYRHAEVRALRPHLNLDGATIYIVRGNGGISKPCPMCMQAIKESGISQIVYYDRNKKIVSERVAA